MSAEIDKLNAKLTKHCKDERIVADEAIFNLGVEFGRYLERSNTKEHRLAYFTKQDEKRSIEDRVYEKRKEVDSIVSAVITAAIKEQIEANGDWEVGYGSYYSDYSKLNDTIVNKYSVQTYSVDQPDRHGDFNVTFEFVGDVRKMLNDCEISSNVTAGVTNNSGDESRAIRNVVDIEDALYGIGINFYNRNDADGLESITTLFDKLSKHYLFLMLSL